MGFWTKLLGLEPPELPVHVDDENFEREILRSKLPVLLDAWSPGCVPCKHLEPIVIRLTSEYRGRVKVAELGVSRAPRAARRLRIGGTPTVVYLRGGRELERAVGLHGELYHRQSIEALLLDEAPAAPADEEAAPLRNA
ncbi:MAG: thiol reductase thioredoxin [Polyangiaceae bacterium]|nr:thiol reductase thioredoxin [Polyangiaceae bacterium]